MFARFVRARMQPVATGVLAAGLLIGSGEVSLAQDDPDYVNCGFFSTQAEAQEYLDTRGTIRDNVIMDPDGNGIACEEAFLYGPMPARLPNTGAGAESSTGRADRALLTVAAGLLGSSLVLRSRGVPSVATRSTRI